MLECEVACRISYRNTSYKLHLYAEKHNPGAKEHLAVVFGEIYSRSLNKYRENDDEEIRMRRGAVKNHQENENDSGCVLIRIHSCCFTGEVLQSGRCDCGEQLSETIQLMSESGRGVLLYLNQEGRGIGLKQKMM